MDEIKKQAKQDYMNKVKHKDICDRYDLSMNTLKSWIKRNGWADERKRILEKGAPENKRGAPLNNKNAVGNKGGNGAPIGNKRAEKHGFYAKHLPAETLELFDELQEMDQLDMIWDSIRIKYAAIIRAQTIMFVEDKYDITEHLKKHKVIKGMSYTEEKEWELQFAWDKYANFLQAQSRAMGELRSLIKSYNELVDRGMATQEQELRIQRLQLEIEKIGGDDKGKDTEEWVKAIEAIAAKRSGKK